MRKWRRPESSASSSSSSCVALRCRLGDASEGASLASASCCMEQRRLEFVAVRHAARNVERNTELQALVANNHLGARVEQLAQKAGKRIQQQGLLKGWGSLHELYEEKKRQRQLLAKAGARLRKPELTATWAAWRSDWRETVRHAAMSKHEREIEAVRSDFRKQLEAAEAEARSLKQQLEI